MKGVGISLAEVYERVGKSMILVCKRPKRANRFIQYGCKKGKKTFWICD